MSAVQLFECFENNIHIIKLSTRDQRFAEMIIENIDKEYVKESSTNNIYIKSSLLQLLIFLNNHRLTEVNETPELIESNNKTISEIVGYINKNYNSEITLESVSELFYISPCHISRTFKKVCGLSFTDYINNVRIKEARKLLHQTDMSISKVAEYTGFNSTTHFNRVFKKVMKLSPLAYKKTL